MNSFWPHWMAFGTKRAKPFKKLLTCRVFHVHDVVEDEIIAFFVDPSCTISQIGSRPGRYSRGLEKCGAKRHVALD